MLKLYISGCKNKNLLSDIRKLCKFVTCRLMKKRLVEQLTINIKLWPNSFCGELEGDIGDCVWEDDPIRPREFTLNIARKTHTGVIQTRDLILETIAHELVHVKQMATGEKYYYQTSNNVRWQGKIINCDKITYWEYPWEHAAYGLERGLTQLWEISNNTARARKKARKKARRKSKI